MFKIIEPQDYCYYRGRVDLFIELMQSRHSLPLSCEEKKLSTFIVGQSDDGHVYGGAILQHQHVSELPDSIEPVISAVIPNQEYVWAATFSCCENQGDTSFFYRDLLKQFTAFGKEKNSRFLCLSLSPEEYLRTKKQEGWPYVLEVAPQDTAEGIFHGILSLSGTTGTKRDTSTRRLMVPSALTKRPLAA